MPISLDRVLLASWPGEPNLSRLTASLLFWGSYTLESMHLLHPSYSLLQALSPALSPVISIPSGFPFRSLASPIQNILVSLRFSSTHTLSLSPQNRDVSRPKLTEILVLPSLLEELGIHTQSHSTQSPTKCHALSARIPARLSNVELTA